MTDPTAREVLLDTARRLEGGSEDSYGLVTAETAIAAMLAFASRSVDEARREERERIAAGADRQAAESLSFQPAGKPTKYGKREAQSFALFATAIRSLPDAPERDGGADG